MPVSDEEYVRAVARGDDFEAKSKTLEAGVLERDQRIRDLAAEKTAEVGKITADLIAERGKAGTLAGELAETTRVLNERNGQLADMRAHAGRLAARVKELEAGQTPAEPPSREPSLEVGVNLDFVRAHSTDGRWANAFRSFEGGGDDANLIGWGAPGKPWEKAAGLKLSPDGYPLSDASAWSYLRGYGLGEYRFSKAGSGTVTFGGRLSQTAPGVVRLLAGDGMGTVTVKGIDPADPPRDFKLLAPGATYRTPFLDAHKPFAVLRLNPDTMRTNRLPVGARVRPGEWNQTSVRGVAYELLADLAAECGTSLWIGVPDWADDAHAEDMARVFLAKLPVGKRLYVEPSNEPWNPGFDQWKRIHAIAKTVSSDGWSSDENERHWQVSADMARHCGFIFKRVAKESGREADVLPVLGVQSANPRSTEIGLKFLADQYGDVGLHAIATTGYYKLPDAVKTAIDAAPSDAVGLDLLFAHYLDPVKGILVTERTRKSRHVALAAAHGVGIVVYECSIELVDHGNPVTDRSARVAKLAQDDPRIAECVRLDLDACRLVYGADLAVWYKGIAPREKEGHFGLASSLDSLGAKWAAAVNYAEAR